MWPHYLLFTRYFRTQKLKIAIFAHCIMIVDPLAEERPPSGGSPSTISHGSATIHR